MTTVTERAAVVDACGELRLLALRFRSEIRLEAIALTVDEGLAGHSKGDG